MSGARSGCAYGLLTAAIAMAVTLTASPRVRYADAAAKASFESTRAAIASSRPLDEIRTLSLRGRLRVPNEHEAPTPTDGEVLIRVALPD